MADDALDSVHTIRRQDHSPDGFERYVATLEVWSTFILVRWTEPRAQFTAPRGRAGFGRWTLNDDVGTTYRSNGAGGGAHGTVVVDCAASFTPAPPPSATHLVLETPGSERIEVTLAEGGP